MSAPYSIIVVLADCTKFDRHGLGKVCNIDHVPYVVTDKGVFKDMLTALEERGLYVVVGE